MTLLKKLKFYSNYILSNLIKYPQSVAAFELRTRKTHWKLTMMVWHVYGIVVHLIVRSRQNMQTHIKPTFDRTKYNLYLFQACTAPQMT